VGGGGSGRASADDRDIHLSWHGRDLHPSVGARQPAPCSGPSDRGGGACEKFHEDLRLAYYKVSQLN
jgi:hypothetical protein